MYKHGYRAYLEIRDDPELRFVCRADGPPLPPPLEPTPAQTAAAAVFNAPAAAAAAVASNPPPVDYVGAIAAASAVATSSLPRDGYDEWDVLPVAPASDLRKVPPPFPDMDVDMREASFPSEKAFKARMDALLNAIFEQQRQCELRAKLRLEWEQEWAREKRPKLGAA